MQVDPPDRTRLKRVIVFVVAVAAYAGSIPSGFVFDDRPVITENPIVQGIVPLRELPFRDWFGLPALHSIGSYRPLATLAFWFDWRIGGGSPAWFHALNMVAHGMAMLLTFVVFRRIVGETVAFAGVLLAAVLVAPSEAVEGAIGRADLFETIAIVGGLAAHRRSGALWGALAALAFGVALGSKESGVLAVVAWLVLDGLAPPDVPFRRRLGRWLAYGVMMTTYLALRLQAIGQLQLPRTTEFYNPLVNAGAVGRIFGAAHIFIERYLLGILDPRRRLYDCSANACRASGPDDPLAWLGLALIVALIVGIGLLRRRSTAGAVGLAWFACFFLPVSNLLVPATLTYGERLLYIPCIGLCFALAALADGVARSLSQPRIAWGIFGFIAVVNAAWLQHRHGDWRSPETLYRSGMAYGSESALVLENNAAMANLDGHSAEAEALARRSIAVMPALPFALTDLAVALDGQGKTKEAEAAFERAVEVNPRGDAMSEYVTFMARHGRFSEALDLVQRYEQQWPDAARLLDLERRLRAAIAKHAAPHP